MTGLRPDGDRHDATPDSLVTVWACQAGKDLYVEKPLSHNIFEGRQTVEAAKKYRRIVQWGKGHLFNFLSAVRSRRESDLRAPLIEGHVSSALVPHTANK
jgi:hypothetical protein